MEKNQKIIFRMEVEENDFDGVKWTTTIIGQSGKPTSAFAEKIFEDLGIEVDSCEYATIQEVVE